MCYFLVMCMGQDVNSIIPVPDHCFSSTFQKSYFRQELYTIQMLHVQCISAKTNILFDGAMTAKSTFVFCHAKRQWTFYSARLAITRLHLCIDRKK